MRFSIWQQDQPRQKWRRLGVVEFELAGTLPFKVGSITSAWLVPNRWPRRTFYALEAAEQKLPLEAKR